MVGKRGQFTIFIVLGFVLISSFAFLLFARSIVVQDKLRTQADMIVQEAIRSSNINFYVKSCLDRVVDDAVYLLSLQGGKLYKNQGGSYQNPIGVGQDYLVFNLTSAFYNISFYNYTNVSYGILPNFNSSCVYPSPPSYPFPNTSIDLIKWTYHNKSSLLYGCSLNTGALGVLSLPPLCDPNGTNRLNASGQDASFYRFGACKFGYGNNSVQEQLQTYISNSLKSCVNFSIFENIGYNVTVLNDPNSTVTFAEKYFVTNVTYPFLVKLGRSKFRTYADFELKKNVRLKQVYEYIQRLLEQEYKNIHFNIESDYRNPRLGWDTKMTLIRAVNPCRECGVGQFDDIFQLVDNESLIGGNPLIFQFAVKNRAPVLDWIHFGMRYNIVVKEGQDIRIDPFGLDPDENLVVYNYSGWMEEFNSSFNEVGCEADPEGCRANPSLYVDNQPWNKVRNWTNSELFQETRRNASYRTSRRDLGLHHTLVHVKDEGGLEDYQNISIMVGDIPVVIPSGDNIYDDISPLNASIEDPYILNALTRSYFTDVLEFKWQDTLEPFTIFTTETEITLPTENLDPPLIEEIKTKNFTVVDPQHEITLKGRYDDNGVERWTDPSMIAVDVHECLPHRDYAAPYPYNSWIGDDSIVDYANEQNPFLADHTCCNDDPTSWGKRTTNNICYEYTDYGSYWSIDTSIFNWDPYDPNLNTYISSYIPLSSEQKNDILQRTFTRKCDGSRGNICKGTADQVITIEQPCTDFSEGPDERCSGPSSDFTTFGYTEKTLPSCNTYYETTFEEIFLSGTGSCDHEELCSNLGDGGYGVGGYYHCNATCDGSGGCTRTIPNLCRDCRDVIDTFAQDRDLNYDCPDPYCLEEARPCIDGFKGDCNDANPNGCKNVRPRQTHIEQCSSCPNCMFSEYDIRDENGNGKPESCYERLIDPDTHEVVCSTHCGQDWFAGSCCGDDDDEHYLDGPDLNEIGISYACCDDDNDCVYNSICYDHLETEDIDNDMVDETCNNGVWSDF